MCLALGVERLDDVAAKLADVLELQPPQGIADKLRGARQAQVACADASPQHGLEGRRARRSCSSSPTSTACRS